MVIEKKNAYYRIRESTYSRSTSFRTGLYPTATEECLHLVNMVMSYSQVQRNPCTRSCLHLRWLWSMKKDLQVLKYTHSYSSWSTYTCNCRDTYRLIDTLWHWDRSRLYDQMWWNADWAYLSAQSIHTITLKGGLYTLTEWETVELKGFKLRKICGKYPLQYTYQWKQYQRSRRNKSLRCEQTEEKEDCPDRTCGNHRMRKHRFEWSWAWNSS